MKSHLEILFQKGNLSFDEAKEAMDELMSGTLPPEIVGAFLGALRAKGETVDEIAGFATSMRNHALRLPIQRTDLLDTCGTGGSGTHVFNVSTICGIILAAAGVGVVKHGNRSVSSRCGSADLLEALGVPLDLSVDRVAASVDQLGFGFLFARALHPAMRHVSQIRVNLGIPTVFNLLGPLTNPAFATRQVLGIFDGSRLHAMAQVLQRLGVEEAMVVSGEDGMDEVTLSNGSNSNGSNSNGSNSNGSNSNGSNSNGSNSNGSNGSKAGNEKGVGTGRTHVAHLKEGTITCYDLTPEDFGLQVCALQDLRGGGIQQNADIANGILDGTITDPKRDLVLANAACALLVAGLVSNVRQGCDMAAEILSSGAARKKLEQIKGFR